MNISQSLTKARKTLNLSQQQIANLAEVSLLIVELCENEATDFDVLTEVQKNDFRKVVGVVKALCERAFFDDEHLH